MPDSGVMVHDTALWYIAPGGSEWTIFPGSTYSQFLAIDYKGNVYSSDGSLSVRNFTDTSWSWIGPSPCYVPDEYEETGPGVSNLAVGPDGRIFIICFMLYTTSPQQMTPTVQDCGGESSSDEGKTWKEAEFYNHFDSNYTPVAYEVGPDMTYYQCVNGQRFEHSTDLGVHWIQSSMVFNNILGMSAVLSGDVLVTDTAGDIYISSNQGMTWESYSKGLTGDTIYAIAEDKTGVVYLGTSKGLYRSTRTFSAPASVGTSASSSNPLRIVPNPATGTIMADYPGDQSTRVIIVDALGREQHILPEVTSSYLQFDLLICHQEFICCELKETVEALWRGL